MYPHLNKNSREDILVTEEKKTHPKVLIAYHKNCIDGFASAWACWKGLMETTDTLDENIELVAVEYGKVDSIMDEADKYDKIYFVDFSIPVEELLILRKYTQVTIIDHHKTAVEMYEGHCDIGSVNIIMDLSECGATLVWKHFFGDREMPRLLSYVRDYDLWQFKYPETKAINMILRLQPQTLHHWDGMVEELEDDSKLLASIAIGKAILKYHATIVDSIVAIAEPCILDGEVGLAVNGAIEFKNDVGNNLARKSGTYGALWQQLPNHEVKWSLRSIGDYDVSALAAKFGGGGHKNAASFTLKAPAEDATQLGITLWSSE